jgi:hypothetical protein
MALMNALSDLAVFDSVEGKGGSVHLTKRLRWVEGARKPGVAQSVERPRQGRPALGLSSSASAETLRIRGLELPSKCTLTPG